MDEITMFGQRVATLNNSQLGLENGVNSIKLDVKNWFDNIDTQWLSSDSVKIFYKEFEGWLNNLFAVEPLTEDISAINFGLFESNDGIQLYKWSKIF